MKIDIAKNTWISDVTLDFIREGYFNGVMGLQITFSGGSCPGDEFIAEVLERLTRVTFPKRRIVRLRGMFDPSDKSMMLLINSFQSYGFAVQAIVPDGFVAPWLEKVNWLIVRIERPIALMAAHEIWYYPTAAETIPEPKLPPKDMLLYLAKGYSVATTHRFVVESSRNWNLL